MIVKDREVGEQATTLYKYADLLTPEHAQNLGIKTEVPVFVSPLVQENFNCEHCDDRIGPLVYQLGYRIKAYHFHPDSASGVYFYDQTCEKPDKVTDWQLLLSAEDDEFIREQSGLFKKKTLRLRSNSVLVRRIRAFCCLYNHGEQISEGLLMEAFYDQSRLTPLCGDLDTAFDVEDEWRPRFRFKIEEGQVLFSQI